MDGDGHLRVVENPITFGFGGRTNNITQGPAFSVHCTVVGRLVVVQGIGKGGTIKVFCVSTFSTCLHKICCIGINAKLHCACIEADFPIR
eukprot:37773-Ditylum_brightwellii.AAC.1